MAGDPKLVAKIALQYQLASREQLTECLRSPEGQADLGDLLRRRGLITPEQQAWLVQAEAYFAAQAAAAVAPAAVAPVGGAPASAGDTGPHRAAATTGSAPAAERPRPSPGAHVTINTAARESAVSQRMAKADLEPAADAPLELDAGSVGAGASARARLRARGGDVDMEVIADAPSGSQSAKPAARAVAALAMAEDSPSAIAIDLSPSHARSAAQRSAAAPAVATHAPVAAPEPIVAAAHAAAAPAWPVEDHAAAPSAKVRRAPDAPAIEPDAPQGHSAAVDAVLAEGVRRRASDIHLHAGLPPLLRIDGQLVALEGRQPLRPDETEAMVRDALNPHQRARFDDSPDIDFSYAVDRVGRFRANAYRQQRGADLVFRAIPAEPPTLEQLGLADSLSRFTDLTQGLVLFTGPSGCGKTTTMSSLIDHVNRNRAQHIITLEAPIEHIHTQRKSLVRQRQILRHTESYARGLRAALREDPNLIAVGEMREFEVIELALTAAETGSLVFGTLPTASSIRTISRLIDGFPAERQAGARAMLAESLRGVISQRLVRRADGKGRVAALEIMMVTTKVAALIREDKQIQIRGLMQVGRSQGMRVLDDSLRDLVAAGTVTKEEARLHAELPASFA